MFAKWREDSEEVLQQAFDSDMALTKCYRFIKEPDDLKATFKVLRRCYESLKHQFNTSIATVKSYPVIDWLDFVSQCHAWKIVDRTNLTSADIDRIFVATNFEEEDLEENDDNALCRYEFSEIIVRMAKTKYFEKGEEPTVAASTERLLRQYILPNSCEVMPAQAFRDELLWCLEVDDVIRANRVGIDLLVKQYATGGNKVQKSLTKDDVLRLHQDCVLLHAQLFNSERAAVMAYCLSKMTLTDEMQEFDKYQLMQVVEFYEFLGRWAYLLYKNPKEPLAKKIQSLLEILLPLVKLRFVPPANDDEIPSESDYDDDVVEQVYSQLYADAESSRRAATCSDSHARKPAEEE